MKISLPKREGFKKNNWVWGKMSLGQADFGPTMQNVGGTTQNVSHTVHNVDHNTLIVCQGPKGGLMCPPGPP